MKAASSGNRGTDANEAMRFRLTRQAILDAAGDPAILSGIPFPDVQTFNWALDWFDWFADSNQIPCVMGPGGSAGRAVISYQQVSQESTVAAGRLQEIGVRPGDRIFVEMPACIDVYIIFLAILKCGAVVIPVHDDLDADSFADRVSVASPGWIITPRVRTGGGASVLQPSDILFLGGSSCSYRQVRRSADLPAFGCFTSGTTGLPKLVLHSQRTHGVAHLSSLAWNDLSPGSRHLNLSSPGWAKFFWSSFLVPLTAGATVVVKSDSVQPAELAEFCNDQLVTSLCAPVPILKRAVTAPGPDLATVTDITSVGEPVPDDLTALVWKRWNIRVRVGYGQSEATAIMGELKVCPGVLAVLPGYEVRVRHKSGEEAGRLEYRSFRRGSFNGYVKDAVLYPPEVDSDGWQWSGDYALGVPGEMGFVILGRGEDVFRINGHVVSPSEVEHQLCRHPLVDAAGVFSYLDASGLRCMASAVVSPGVGEKQLASIRSWINLRLPDDVSVERIESIDGLPMSINGKLQRNLLSLRHQM